MGEILRSMVAVCQVIKMEAVPSPIYLKMQEAVFGEHKNKPIDTI